MKRLGKEFEVHVYQEATHVFLYRQDFGTKHGRHRGRVAESDGVLQAASDDAGRDGLSLNGGGSLEETRMRNTDRRLLRCLVGLGCSAPSVASPPRKDDGSRW